MNETKERPLGRGKFWEQPHRGQLQQRLDKFSGKEETDELRAKEKRGSLTGESSAQEVSDLRRVISENGQKSADGKVVITFGELYQLYATISNKVVGILMRARKQGVVQFEGEMLWKLRDDQLPITLLN